jgi:hypothetical protein
LKPLPTFDKTKKGNFAEIVLAEYLLATSKLDLLVYRLRYNTNVDQSMTGDDVLLLNRSDLHKKIIVGEAKFRTTPNKNVVDEIINSFKGDKRFPISITFLSHKLSQEGNDELAEKLEDLQTDLYKMRIPIINVGFLFSSLSAPEIIENNAIHDNPYLIILSLGVNKPFEIVNEAYQLAQKRLEE